VDEGVPRRPAGQGRRRPAHPTARTSSTPAPSPGASGTASPARTPDPRAHRNARVALGSRSGAALRATPPRDPSATVCHHPKLNINQREVGHFKRPHRATASDRSHKVIFETGGRPFGDLAVSVRVARSGGLVADGYALAAVARVVQMTRQALYWVPNPPRPPPATPTADGSLDAAIVAVAKAYPTDGRIVTAWAGPPISATAAATSRASVRTPTRRRGHLRPPKREAAHRTGRVPSPRRRPRRTPQRMRSSPSLLTDQAANEQHGRSELPQLSLSPRFRAFESVERRFQSAPSPTRRDRQSAASARAARRGRLSPESTVPEWHDHELQLSSVASDRGCRPLSSLFNMT